jgi:hypothetical protein
MKTPDLLLRDNHKNIIYIIEDKITACITAGIVAIPSYYLLPSVVDELQNTGYRIKKNEKNNGVDFIEWDIP